MQRKKPCCSDLILKEFGVIFKEKQMDKENLCHQGGTAEDGMTQPRRNTKITKSTTARLIFLLDPNCQGINTICFFFKEKKISKKTKKQKHINSFAVNSNTVNSNRRK